MNSPRDKFACLPQAGPPYPDRLASSMPGMSQSNALEWVESSWVLADHHVLSQILSACFCRALLAVDRVVLIEVVSKDHDTILVDRFDVCLNVMVPKDIAVAAKYKVCLILVRNDDNRNLLRVQGSDEIVFEPIHL